MQFLSVNFQCLAAEVDRKAGVLRGYVVATEGDFRDGRGAFDKDGLSQIAKMINASREGLKSRFGHPSLFSDGLGRFLGRVKNARMDYASGVDGDRVPAVRAELHFDKSAYSTPNGDLATYTMDLAESDKNAISSSLVIVPQIVDRGRGLSPVWYPEQLEASDVVETGAAVGSILDDSTAARRNMPAILSRVFAGMTPADVKAAMSEWHDATYGGQSKPTPVLDKYNIRLAEIDLTTKKLRR